MTAEIMFLGLMMFCVDTDNQNCPLVNDGNPPGRVYLVDGTPDALWCNDNGCEACGKPVHHHAPYLIYHKDHVDQPLLGQKCVDIPEILKVCEQHSCHLLDDLYCLPLANKKITFKIELAADTLQPPKLTPKGGRKKEDKEPDGDPANDHLAYDWVASMWYFGSWQENQLVEPIKLEPGSRRAIAWVDLSDHGELQAKLLGPGDTGPRPKPSLWGSTRGKVPPGHAKRRALANGVAWSIINLEKLEVCAASNCMPFKNGIDPKAVVLNLPMKVFEGCTDHPSEPEVLDHFRMYYQLFRDPGSCGAPTIKERKSLPNCLPIKAYLEGTEDKPDATPRTRRVDDALCPPSKFP